MSPHPRCELQLAVLNSTSSSTGGHKFKLSRLFVTGAVVDSAVADSAASGGKGGQARGDQNEFGALKGMKEKHCRGPLCQPSAGGKRRGGRGGGGPGRFIRGASPPEDPLHSVPGLTQALAAHTHGPVAFGDVDDAILAARNAALSLLRAARNERSGQVREGSLRLLLQPSLLPAPAV